MMSRLRETIRHKQLQSNGSIAALVMNAERRTLTVIFLLSFLILGCLLSCTKNNSEATSTPTSQEPPAKSTPQRTPLTQFESDLQYVRNGGYTYIWTFARKDGKLLDKDDGAYLKKNAPQVVDWVTTDQGRKVIAGTNFDLEKGNLELLKKRFLVEDYSGK